MDDVFKKRYITRGIGKGGMTQEELQIMNVLQQTGQL